jgi:hypothetical protein
MSHHLYLLRAVPGLVEIHEAADIVLTEPLPTRVRSPRTAQHAGLLHILDQRMAVTSRAREARQRIRPGFVAVWG